MCYFTKAVVDFNGIQVMLFFFKTSRKGKWNILLTTDLALNYGIFDNQLINVFDKTMLRVEYVTIEKRGI